MMFQNEPDLFTQNPRYYKMLLTTSSSLTYYMRPERQSCSMISTFRFEELYDLLVLLLHLHSV